MSAVRIGIALRGRQNGTGWLVRCPCPGHGKGRGDVQPSLSVADGDDGRLLLRCFAGCEFGAILNELKRRGLVDDNGRNSALTQNLPARHVPPAGHQPAAAALEIWRGARPAAGTVVEQYLRRRGIAIVPPSLRCGSVMHLHRYEMPVMVAGVQRPDGQVVAVQTTILTPKGTKAPVGIPKLTHGALGAGAVRFAPAAETMGLAEGCETALSAQIMAGIPVWASLGCQRLHRVELPSLVREIHIFGDNDAPGRTAAERAAQIHAAFGRKVVIRFPPADSCGDWNDFIIQRAAERAA